MSPDAPSLKDEYKSMLKAVEVEEILDLILYRPLAYGLVKILQPTAVTPNQVTFISLVLGLVSGVFFWQGTPTFLAWGALLLFLTNLFDCADGMLARVRGTSSLTGYLFDGLVDYTTNTAVIVGMLHGLHVQGVAPLVIWLVGVPAGLSYAWWCAMVDRFRNEWMDKVYGRRRDPAEELAGMRTELAKLPPGGNRWDRILIGIYGIYVQMWYSAPAPQACCPRDGVGLEAWSRVRRPIMQAAVLLGPTMHLSLMMAAGVANRLEWYFWFALVGGTAYGMTVLAWRTLIDRRLMGRMNEGVGH